MWRCGQNRNAILLFPISVFDETHGKSARNYSFHFRNESSAFEADHRVNSFDSGAR